MAMALVRDRQHVGGLAEDVDHVDLERDVLQPRG
jgi:hypothetical protein